MNLQRPTILVPLLAAIQLFGVSCGPDRLRYQASRPSTSPDGANIVFGSDLQSRGDLYSVTRDGSRLSRLTVGADAKGWPAFSPDGRSIVYAVESALSDPWHISRIRADEHHSEQITSTGASDIAPSYSPDGKYILFARAAVRRPYSMGGVAWDKWDIWIMNADGSMPRQLTSQRYYSIDPPYVSPDGKKVLFAATPTSATGEAVTNRLYVCNLAPDDSPAIPKPLPLAHSADYDGQPRFSADGLRIVFVSRSGSRGGVFDYEIWTATADGRNCRQVTHDQSLDKFPVFSPEGKLIYYFSDPTRIGARQLRKIAANGSDQSEPLIVKGVSQIRD